MGWGKWGVEGVADAVGSDPKSPGAGPRGEQREQEGPNTPTCVTNPAWSQEALGTDVPRAFPFPVSICPHH